MNVVVVVETFLGIPPIVIFSSFIHSGRNNEKESKVS